MLRKSLLIAGTVVALAGCGGEQTVAPLPNTIVGTLAKSPSIPKGDATKGKATFASSGCGGCHTYKPAASHGMVGPDLDNLASDAKQANQGTVDQYTFTSIDNPSAYVVPKFPDGVMPNYGQQLSKQQIADLVAFLTKPQS